MLARQVESTRYLGVDSDGESIAIAKRLFPAHRFLSQLVLTTPHPSVRGFHELGARVGLFSREGAMEHHELINRGRMIQLAETSGFRIRHFRRFLSGCNQLFVLEPVEEAQ